MSDRLTIRSHKGPYSVIFDERVLTDPALLMDGEPHFIVDASVARLHASRIRRILDHPRTQIIEALEENKSIERIAPVMERLVADNVRRDHLLVAIGGGIVQDITCFTASVLLRGISWKFVPTTLLAQADSCIGSKSSINLGETKNILGTFYPPREIFLCQGFLDSLKEDDIRSGIGEILKVHAIESAAAYDALAADYDRLLMDRSVLSAYTRRALHIKQRYIEEDEFDRGPRNIFNYGHSFGHAIESATHYKVPHGIAVTMGIHIANRVAVLRGLLPERQCQRMRTALRKNYAPFAKTPIELAAMLSALTKDKKNTSSKLVLILPVGDDARIQRVEVSPDEIFQGQCRQALSELGA